MRVLIACEESQTTTIEFRKLGIECFSCDIQDCSGGHPEWHIKGDVLPLLDDNWDLIIAHPPCTYLTCTGNGWFNIDKYGDKAFDRFRQRDFAIDFFMRFVNCKCDHVLIENPIGCMSTVYRKPDQIINPYEFGDPVPKATCLWLKGLPILFPTCIVEPDYITLSSGKRMSRVHYESFRLPPDERSRIRSKTYPGIAQAIASQYTYFLRSEGYV